MSPQATPENRSVQVAIERLAARKDHWRSVPVTKKLALLDEIHDILRVEIDHEAWAKDALGAMGIPTSAEIPLAVEMLVNTSMITRDIESLIDSLAAIAHHGEPMPIPLRTLPSGQVVADVFPRPWHPADRFGPNGDWKVEVRMREGQAASRRMPDPAQPGRLTVVLAAGNQGFLGIFDALHRLFVEGETVLLKHHPVRAYNHPWCERLFAPLIREGYLASCVGDVPLASFAVHHPQVDHVHMTGGKKTHDAIVWGEPGPEQDRRRADNDPALTKPITSELGCITPWIVVPGEYTAEQLRHQATHLATSFAGNNSANCCAPKLLVLAESWPQREAFLDALRQALRAHPHPPPYYPGSRARYDALVAHYQDHDGFEAIHSDIPAPPTFGPLGPAIPWTLVEIPYREATVPLSSKDAHPLLTEEPFCPILGICTIPGQGTRADYLSSVTRLCNESVMGTLSCTLVMPEALFDDSAVSQAISELRYGTVAVNAWTGSCCLFGEATWGAFPGETLDAVQSGVGCIRNYLLFEHPEKTVAFTPLISPAHIGTTSPPSLTEARGLCAFITGQTNTERHNEGNGFCQGNFVPVDREGIYADLEVEGQIPTELDGMYVRNGTNSRFPANGRSHMFDGDAMLHCVRLQGGAVRSYARQWVKPSRFAYNEAAGRELYPSFGDVSIGGIDVARKLGLFAMKTNAGTVPPLPANKQANPSTSTCFIGERMYAIVETSPPFRIYIDPETGAVTSGGWDDMGGHADIFTAHHRICPTTGELHFFARPPMVGAVQASDADAAPSLRAPHCTYGVLDRNAEPVHTLKFPVAEPTPAFLHDYFLTENFAIVVDHSLRLDPSKIALSGMFDFRVDMPLRFGVMPRRCTSADQIQWFSTGRPGFVWHVVAGWEEQAASGGRQLVLWLPIFDEYPPHVPIHLPEEPHSHLHRVVLDLERNEVAHLERAPQMESTVVERADVNRAHFGRPQRWAYLMKRAEGRPMYDGFVKYDLQQQRVAGYVEYGADRLGGECYFIGNPNGETEDDGWLLDIVHDAAKERSELCIWSASDLSCVARVRMPERVPFGVHANWLDATQLAAQWAARPRGGPES